jgi:hypothetical protein
MANFALNYSFSRNLNIPLDEDAVKGLRSEVVSYVQTKSKCYAGQLFSVTGDTAENNGLYVALSTGAEGVVIKLASQDALDAVAASAGKIDKIQLNGTELTINDKVVNIDLSTYATIEYVDEQIEGLADKYAPKSEFEEVQKKVEEITSTGGEPNVQSDWNTTDTEADSFIKNKPDLEVYATKTALSEAEEALKDYTDDAITALTEVYASKSVVDTLVGEDTDKSARAIAAEEVAKIVASADTDFDTLKEIADWITNDTVGAAQMSNDIATLKAVSADTRLATLEAETHTHDNKTVLDGITSEKVSAWDAAEQNAKDYADGKESAIHTWVEDKNYLTEHQDISKLATKDEVATAKSEATSYTDTEIGKLSEVYDAKNAAATAKSEAISEAKSYTDTEIGKLGNTYATTASVDTIKTTLENKITTDINSAKSEVNTTAKGYADAAEGAAKTYADGLAVNYDKKGDAETALNSAKAYADGLAENYDAAGAAEEALKDAKEYANGLASNYDAAGAAEEALKDAKEYADGLASNYDAAGAAASAAASALTDAKNFTTTEIGKLSEVYDEKGAASSALTDSKKYTDDKLVDYATKSYVTDTIVGQLSGGTIVIEGYAKVEDVKNQISSAKTEAFEAASGYTDTEIAKLSNVYASKSVVDTLVGEDTEKSARDIAAEEVAKVVAEAPEAYDTLKEIADYIANDITSAATIINDIAELKGIDAETRLGALEAISGESHTHENKALLDTYTQTEVDLADAVSKKHAHENKTVLDGITAEKVAAWDGAEQNAKDYADGLVENIKPYEGGIAANISMGENDTYVVDVKVSDAEKNFIKVNTENELEVSAITLDAAITSKDITIEGGQWEAAVKTVYTGGTVPAGTTWESFLESMLCVEKFPGTISTTSAFTVSFGTLDPGVDKSGTVEVGTSVTLNKVNALNTTAHTQSISVGSFSGADGKTYGYKKGEDGSHVNSKTYTETLTPTLSASSKALKVTFSGFVDAVNSGSAIATKTAEGSIEAVTMYAMSGTNKVTVYQTGDTYTSSSAVTAGTLYAATNLKNYYKSDKVTPNTITPSCPVVNKTATGSKEYTVTGQFKYFIGDVTDYAADYWDTDRSSVVRGLKTTGWTSSTSITVSHTFKTGTKQQTVVVPAKYTSVAGKDVNNGDVTFNHVKTFDFTNAQGYISSYKVFVAPAADGLGADSKITITIK